MENDRLHHNHENTKLIDGGAGCKRPIWSKKTNERRTPNDQHPPAMHTEFDLHYYWAMSLMSVAARQPFQCIAGRSNIE